VKTELCNIMKNHGSDKGADWHNYTQIYSVLFNSLQNEVRQLFELGIGSVNPAIASHMKQIYSPGGSLRGWREFFPTAQIYAADIDKDILQPEERITKFYVDQTDAGVVKEMWNQVGKNNFDIIIDDGLHTYKANKTFFENSYTQLSDTGIFIIEDIPNNELNHFRTELATIARELDFDTRLLQLKHNSNKTDNNIMIITKNLNYINTVDSMPAELFI
jgi:hypothetical protein